jgi:hypothetical protein
MTGDRRHERCFAVYYSRTIIMMGNDRDLRIPGCPAVSLLGRFTPLATMLVLFEVDSTVRLLRRSSKAVGDYHFDASDRTR